MKNLTYFCKTVETGGVRAWLFVMITHIYNYASIFENYDKSLTLDSCIYSVDRPMRSAVG